MMPSLGTISLVLGVLLASGALFRGLWRVVRAVVDLVTAVTENTAATSTLTAEFGELRRDVVARLDDHGQRLTRLEGTRR